MKTITLDKEVSFEEGVKGLLSGEYYGIKPKDGSNYLILNRGNDCSVSRDSLVWVGHSGGFVTLAQYGGQWHPVIVDHRALNDSATRQPGDPKYKLLIDPERRITTEEINEDLAVQKVLQQQADRFSQAVNTGATGAKRRPEWNYNPILGLATYYREIQSSAIKRAILSWLDENTKCRDKDYDRLYLSLHDEYRSCQREQAADEVLAYIHSFCSDKYAGEKRRTAACHMLVDNKIDHQLWEQGQSWLPEGLKLRLSEWVQKTLGTTRDAPADYHDLMNMLTQKCVGGFDIYVLLGDPFTNRVFHRVLVLMEKQGVDMQRLSDVSKEAVYLLASIRHEPLQELTQRAYKRGDLFGTKTLVQLKQSVRDFLEKSADAPDAQQACEQQKCPCLTPCLSCREREQAPKPSAVLRHQAGNQDDPHGTSTTSQYPLHPLTGFSFGGAPAPTLHGDLTIKTYSPLPPYPAWSSDVQITEAPPGDLSKFKIQPDGELVPEPETEQPKPVFLDRAQLIEKLRLEDFQKHPRDCMPTVSNSASEPAPEAPGDTTNGQTVGSPVSKTLAELNDLMEKEPHEQMRACVENWLYSSLMNFSDLYNDFNYQDLAHEINLMQDSIRKNESAEFSISPGLQEWLSDRLNEQAARAATQPHQVASDTPSTTMKMAKLSHVNLLWLTDKLAISSKQAFFTELFELIQPHSAYQGIDLQEYLRVYQTTTTPADQTDPTLQTR